ncbi:hypothetical protein C3L33_09984, partial [Rhododendron williamsianum]
MERVTARDKNSAGLPPSKLLQAHGTVAVVFVFSLLAFIAAAAALSGLEHLPPATRLAAGRFRALRRVSQRNLPSAVQPHSPTAAAPDYFSLDLDKDETTVDLTPVWSAAATPLRNRRGGLKAVGLGPIVVVDIAEILDFCNFLSPTPEEQASRNAAVRSVFDVIQYIWPNCKVSLSLSLSLCS